MSEIKNAKIRSVSLGFEDHGILTCWLHLDYGGVSQGFGGYGFSHRPKDKHIGAPDLADFLLGILTTLEVDTWEALVGKSVRADADHGGVKRIGHYLKDQWFDPQSVVGRRRLTDEKPMTFEEALREGLRTLEGAARYDQQRGSSRSSRLTRERREEIIRDAVAAHQREVEAARQHGREDALLTEGTWIANGKVEKMVAAARLAGRIEQAEKSLRLIVNSSVPYTTLTTERDRLRKEAERDAR